MSSKFGKDGRPIALGSVARELSGDENSDEEDRADSYMVGYQGNAVVTMGSGLVNDITVVW